MKIHTRTRLSAPYGGRPTAGRREQTWAGSEGPKRAFMLPTNRITGARGARSKGRPSRGGPEKKDTPGPGACKTARQRHAHRAGRSRSAVGCPPSALAVEPPGPRRLHDAPRRRRLWGGRDGDNPLVAGVFSRARSVLDLRGAGADGSLRSSARCAPDTGGVALGRHRPWTGPVRASPPRKRPGVPRP